VQVKIAALLSLAACNVALGGSSGTTSFSGPSGAAGGGKTGGTIPAGNDRATREKFVSTKETAAKLNGLPGLPCDPESEAVARRNLGWKEPCWDPPGGTEAIPLAHLAPGKREIRKPDFTGYDPRWIIWFDAPREATPTESAFMMVPSGDPERPLSQYEPYALKQGFAKPSITAMKGRSLSDALAAFDAMDLPFIVIITWSECPGPNDTVCEIDDEVSSDGTVRMTAAMRIRYRGTDKEERELPDGLEGMKTEDAVAKLKKIGFTNIEIVEKDLPCERGFVCSTYRPGWHRTSQKIELEVRRAKKSQ
jgi:hypothetical protein